MEVVGKQCPPQLVPVEMFHSTAELLHHGGSDANNLRGRRRALFNVTDVVARGKQMRRQLFCSDKTRVASRAYIGQGFVLLLVVLDDMFSGGLLAVLYVTSRR